MLLWIARTQDDRSNIEFSLNYKKSTDTYYFELKRISERQSEYNKTLVSNILRTIRQKKKQSQSLPIYIQGRVFRDWFLDTAKLRSYLGNQLGMSVKVVGGDDLITHPAVNCRVCNQFAQSKCGNCLNVAYCSKKCQQVDWVEGNHKQECAKE